MEEVQKSVCSLGRETQKYTKFLLVFMEKKSITYHMGEDFSCCIETTLPARTLRLPVTARTVTQKFSSKSEVLRMRSGIHLC